MGIGKSGRDRRWVRVRSLGCWILKAETGLLARDRRNQYFENIGVSTPRADRNMATRQFGNGAKAGITRLCMS